LEEIEMDATTEELPEVTFHNVTICFPTTNAKDAYTALCEALAALGEVEWNTSTYDFNGHSGETSELFPQLD
jgi:hypothetical protein